MTKIMEKVFLMMKKHKITQTELAEKCGYTREHLNRILNGTVKASKDTEQRVLEAVERIINESAR